MPLKSVLFFLLHAMRQTDGFSTGLLVFYGFPLFTPATCNFLPWAQVYSSFFASQVIFSLRPIKRINDLQDYIAQQTTQLTEFDESLVRRWIKQITIWDDRITVELKSGVSIDVNA